MRDDREHNLATKNVGKLLWQLSLPAGIGMFVMALYNIVDTMFVGQAVGPQGIAALSIVFPIQMFIMSLGGMSGIGGASIISRALGSRNKDRAEITLGNVITIALISGLAVTLVILPNAEFWLNVLGATEGIIDHAREYMIIVLWGSLFQTFTMSVNNAVRAEGNAKVAMVTMIIGAVVNIGLDALFIMKFEMGIRGAALATVIAQASSCVFLIRYYMSSNSTLKIHIKNFKLKLGVLREIIAIGAASFVRMVSTSFVMVVLNRLVVTMGGDLYLAAVGIVGRVSSFAIMPLIAIAQGMQPVLGFSYGAKSYDRSITATNTSIKIATVVAVSGFATAFFFSNSIISLFSTDPLLIDIGSNVMRSIFLAWYLVGFQTIGSTVFQAIGKAKPAFITAISRQVIFLLPLLIIMPHYVGLKGIWWAFPISDALAFGVTLALFLPQIRRLKEKRDFMERGYSL